MQNQSFSRLRIVYKGSIEVYISVTSRILGYGLTNIRVTFLDGTFC